MRKKGIFLIILVCLFVVTGCDKESSINFKKEYEKVNGKTMKDNIKYRNVNINKKNPYVKVSIKDIEKKIKNYENFYLYVGDEACPWCRSGIEKMIEVANKQRIKTIYYLELWDENHDEKFRDLYEIEIKDQLVIHKRKKEAQPEYKTLLDKVSKYAQDYIVTKDGKEYNLNIKRTYGGDHFYFEKGECTRYVSLRSDKLKNANDKLTKKVLKDQESKFTAFFTNKKTCTGDENC